MIKVAKQPPIRSISVRFHRPQELFFMKTRTQSSPQKLILSSLYLQTKPKKGAFQLNAFEREEEIKIRIVPTYAGDSSAYEFILPKNNCISFEINQIECWDTQGQKLIYTPHERKK